MKLVYKYDMQYILTHKKKIKNELLEKNSFIEKNIAILGGSTTSEIKNILELFLLDYGIKPVFYESEFGKYYEDIMFENEELDNFKPDIIYIHTSNKNIINYPNILNSFDEVDLMLENEFKRFVSIWDKIYSKYNCVIIQNNFEYPSYRLLGNRDAYDKRGRVNYITRLNQMVYDYAISHKNFYINDINYLSSSYGLDKWSNDLYWHMYKYALELPAIPYLSFNVAKIIKSIYGKNKKGLVLDLDNTLWGGIVGDDGCENIKVGPDNSEGQVFYEFHKYLKELKNMGVILNINSKNEYENALAGLNNPGSLLKKDDFIIVKANWNPKNINFEEIANELNIGTDSLVFIDDNPVERKIVTDYVDGSEAPDIISPENYIKVIDKMGYFEMTNFSEEDLRKSEMYKDNAKRSEMMSSFDNYDDYLKSLNMKAEINLFDKIYFERISQLSNKSNQFNLTTKRYSTSDIENIANSNDYIGLYGKLSDIFGDNGLISVVIGKKKDIELHVDLWIMSCRVLKRNMEYAMLDKLVNISKEEGIKKIIGYYYPTAKNKMVSDFYLSLGFKLLSEDSDGNKIYEYDISDYKNKNDIIEVL